MPDLYNYNGSPTQLQQPVGFERHRQRGLVGCSFDRFGRLETMLRELTTLG